ncbi:unnamed protein product [Spirodela intermedia]|uniref:S-acyltransferase n=1 Tax=Spirodela intermedia TaxID=51605 RepID=A0A7I8IHW7_SPIIN|nr:unnamed protein product [Spirodela intermedia]CAA6657442.1 unnamed protein product [Spirodela intermedia]
MRKHGWQLPYHPLQVCGGRRCVPGSGFCFLCLFVPFVGSKQLEYAVIGLYTLLVTCVLVLYIWCAAADPGDSGVFKSKKYLTIVDNELYSNSNKSKVECISISSTNNANALTIGEKLQNEALATETSGRKSSNNFEMENSSSFIVSFCQGLLGWCPLSSSVFHYWSREQSSKQQSEDDMFYCTLCEVEVYKYSKHCRVCDKCVDGFDHHCRWINNCVGRKNYRTFFVLTLSSVLLLVLQWLIGVLVLVRCFLERRRFTVDIALKLGSSFSLVPFVIVVVTCTLLAMTATLPLAQLFLFHVLLIKKGLSTYDYVMALRNQEQQEVGSQHSPQISTISSFTGLSSASSFTNFRQGTWCTPPRLFLRIRKRIPGTSAIEINPWALARMNAEEVSTAAAQAKKKSRVLQPVTRSKNPLVHNVDGGSTSGDDPTTSRMDRRRRINRRGKLHAKLPHEPLATISASASGSNGRHRSIEASTSFAPLQLEPRSAFHSRQAMDFTWDVPSSPDSTAGSPDLHPFRVSSGAEDPEGLSSPLPSLVSAAQEGILPSSSVSDGYEASAGEDSDRVPSRTVHRSSDWGKLLAESSHGDGTEDLKVSSSPGLRPWAWPYRQ